MAANDKKDNPNRQRPWYARQSTRKFKTDKELEDACMKYFDWAEKNPLKEMICNFYQGKPNKTPLPKMRAWSVKELCIHIGISEPQWYDWKREDKTTYREDLAEVIRWAEAVIFTQKFTGASADLLNSSIIMRDLGLTDKQEVVSDSHVKITDPQEHARQVAERLKQTLKKESED